MRKPSVSLPTRQARDPHEKPGRFAPDPKDPSLLSRARIAWMSQTPRARLLKAAAVLLVFGALAYFFSYSGPDVYRQVTHYGDGGQEPADSSYGTARCKKSYSRDKPIVQYVLMIDAGSTGSRIHVYKFNNCGATPELESEEFKMTEGHSGGLSAYKDDPDAAARSLDVLMKVAVDTVPDALKGCSPVAVKATAGLRMVGDDKAGAILQAVRAHLERDYPFPVVSADRDGVVVMDGSLEGVYAWITTNYLLGKIGGPDRSPTAAVFDLGGGSTQIVFEPTFRDAPAGGMPERMEEGDHKYDLDFGGSRFELYQHSHLGYGLVSAREAMHKVLLEAVYDEHKGDSTWMTRPVVHPCLPPNVTAEAQVAFSESHALGSVSKWTFTGPSSPAPAQCRALAEKILRKEEKCPLAPCSFNGIHQPSLAKTFAREDVYIFSYFFDRTKPLGMPDSFTLREMHDLANTVCAGEEAWDVFGSVEGALGELRGNDMYCTELSFMVALLHTGYDMPIEREVRVAKKIKGNELGWCLGASLPLLASGSGWECKVREVH